MIFFYSYVFVAFIMDLDSNDYLCLGIFFVNFKKQKSEALLLADRLEGVT